MQAGFRLGVSAVLMHLAMSHDRIVLPGSFPRNSATSPQKMFKSIPKVETLSLGAIAASALQLDCREIEMSKA